jgi:hypothetical protein
MNRLCDALTRLRRAIFPDLAISGRSVIGDLRSAVGEFRWRYHLGGGAATLPCKGAFSWLFVNVCVDQNR